MGRASASSVAALLHKQCYDLSSRLYPIALLLDNLCMGRTSASSVAALLHKQCYDLNMLGKRKIVIGFDF
jgi:purine nucleoside permease